MSNSSSSLLEIRDGLSAGSVIPYLGHGVWSLAPESPVPSTPQTLVSLLTAKASVPHKIRNNLTAAAQYIENFKHRKTISSLMTENFKGKASPTPIHTFLASFTSLPVIVNTWYDDAMRQALAGRSDWGEIQGVSQAEHLGEWVNYFNADGSLTDAAQAESWPTVLYSPIGSVEPASNFLVSDSDYVEVLTEIDIQTPIPQVVQQRRSGRNFLFLGCRFTNQIERNFARQIMKRSSDKHWMVIQDKLTRNELRFIQEQNISLIEMPLAEALEILSGTRQPEVAKAAA